MRVIDLGGCNRLRLGRLLGTRGAADRCRLRLSRVPSVHVATDVGAQTSLLTPRSSPRRSDRASIERRSSRCRRHLRPRYGTRKLQTSSKIMFVVMPLLRRSFPCFQAVRRREVWNPLDARRPETETIQTKRDVPQQPSRCRVGRPVAPLCSQLPGGAMLEPLALHLL